MLDPEFKAKWLAALRSGEYAQCKGKLKRDNGYCCIGVAAVVAGYTIDTAMEYIHRPDGSGHGYTALDQFGLNPDNRAPLIAMNDAGRSFAEIADRIERTL